MGGKDLRIAKSLPFKSAPKPALARPSHGHLLNLLFNGDLNPNVSVVPIWFDPLGSSSPRRGLCPVGGRALSCGRERS